MLPDLSTDTGGYVSFELAHAAARFGAKATILHRSARPLKRFDADVVEHLVAATRDAGIDVRLETEVEAVEQVTGGLEVQTQSASGGTRFEADLVVHGAGRVPEIDDLDLPQGDVRREKGVVVNEYLQSDRIVGAHLLGPHAEEVINVFAVAMRVGMRASDLKQMRFAYPTSTSDIGSML